MLVVLLFAVSNCIEIEDKEDVCYALAIRSIRSRNDEINKYAADNQFVTSPALKSKLIEDGFKWCMFDIQEQDVQSLKGKANRNYNEYLHLVMVPLKKYKNLQDLQLTKEFFDKKSELAARIEMYSKGL
jgi:hypothetical protein